MTDPFFMLMLMNLLGRDYIVWDKAASIDFVSPGKGPVYAEFRVDDGLLEPSASTPLTVTNTCPSCTSTCTTAKAPWSPGCTRHSMCGSSRARGKPPKECTCKRI